MHHAPAGRIVDVAPTVIAAGTSTELTLIGTNLRDVACRFDGVVVDKRRSLMLMKLGVLSQAAPPPPTVSRCHLDGALFVEVEAISCGR